MLLIVSLDSKFRECEVRSKVIEVHRIVKEGDITLSCAAMAVAASSKVPKAQVIRSPSMALSYLVSVASLLTGAAVVHNIFKPDLTIPDLSSQDKETEAISNTASVE